MGKYLKTKPNSLESAVLEAVSPAQQAAIAIAKKEKGEKPKNEKTECPQCEGKGCDHCDGKGYHEEVSEKMNFSDKEVKMAIGIASDKRYKGGNYTGAVNAIEKIKKGLSDHPQVKAVLKRQNEDKEVDEGSKEEYEKFFKAALKKFGVDSPADFKSDEEKKKFFDYIDKNYEGEGEKSEQVNEKVEYVEYKFKNRRDAEQANEYFRGIQLMDLDINDDGISDGELAIDAGKKDMTKYHKEVMKKFKPQVMTQEKKEVEVKESTNPYVDAAAKHISTMWKEAAKVKKEEDEPKKKEDSKTTMTGKPMSGVQVNPLGKE
jgi:hypothetical protein